MSVYYEVISEDNVLRIKELCNELMIYQKFLAKIHPEFFDGMSFEIRMLPALKSSKANFIVVAKDGEEVVGYAYSNIASKYIYTNNFATLNCDAFFDFNSVNGEDVGCLSQFYIKDEYRNRGIGSMLFDKSMEWLNSFDYINDIFIFVSNGNENALKFYLNKGFKISHQILDGFIIVLRNL
ncbi:GNAT family N-acetyltransferase [Caldicellulosiruptoraceae bacterium PP1]